MKVIVAWFGTSTTSPSKQEVRVGARESLDRFVEYGLIYKAGARLVQLGRKLRS